MERTDYFYFIIDVSGSMSGRKIGSVNDSLNNIIYRLKRFAGKESLTVKVIVMTYAGEPKWSNSIPEDIINYSFTDVFLEGEQSNLGRALEELNQKLTRQGITDKEQGRSTTVVLFTDGLSTDDLQNSVNELNKNPVYVNSTRIGVTFDEDLSLDIAEKNLKLLINKDENLVVDNFVKLNKMLFEKYK